MRTPIEKVIKDVDPDTWKLIAKVYINVDTMPNFFTTLLVCAKIGAEAIISSANLFGETVIIEKEEPDDSTHEEWEDS